MKYSKWAAPVVPIVKEDGSLQLCGDYKVTVNPSLVPDTYQLPRVDDLFAALSGGKSFSKLDLKHAYLQVSLDDVSKKYTTINTQKGLYQYERLPFGVSSAPPSSSESWTTSSVTFLMFASTWMTFWSQARQKQNTCTTSTKCYNVCNHLVLCSRKTNASLW